MSELSEAAMEVLGSSDGAAQQEAAPKRRGRPPGSKNRIKDASGNPIPETRAQPMGGAGFVYMKDENSVKASVALGMTVWFLASMMLPVRSLTEQEGIMLGEALDPVLCRWIPVFGEWKYEAGLLMVIMTLYFATATNGKVPPDGVTESMESGPETAAS